MSFGSGVSEVAPPQAPISLQLVLAIELPERDDVLLDLPPEVSLLVLSGVSALSLGILLGSPR